MELHTVAPPPSGEVGTVHTEFTVESMGSWFVSLCRPPTASSPNGLWCAVIVDGDPPVWLDDQDVMRAERQPCCCCYVCLAVVRSGSSGLVVFVQCFQECYVDAGIGGRGGHP